MHEAHACGYILPLLTSWLSIKWVLACAAYSFAMLLWTALVCGTSMLNHASLAIDGPSN